MSALTKSPSTYQRRWQAVAAVDRGLAEAAAEWERLVDPALSTDSDHLVDVEVGLHTALRAVQLLRNLPGEG